MAMSEFDTLRADLAALRTDIETLRTDIERRFLAMLALLITMALIIGIVGIMKNRNQGEPDEPDLASSIELIEAAGEEISPLVYGAALDDQPLKPPVFGARPPDASLIALG